MFGGLTIKMLFLHARQTAFKFLWGWGANDYGQLGTGDTSPRSVPVKVSSLTDWRCVNSGKYHTVSVKAFRSLWSWGRNNSGQLGLNNTVSRSSPTQIGTSTDWFELVSGLNQENTSFKGYHSVAVRAGAGGFDPKVALWSWGRNNYGQLGDGTTTNRSSPVLVSTSLSFDWGYENPSRWPVRVSAGLNHTVAIAGGLSAGFNIAINGGTLWSWGRNHRGQLGHGNTTTASKPTQVGTDDDLSGLGWLSVSCGDNHTVAIKNRGGEGTIGLTSGTLWAWGYNFYGQLGLRDATNRSVPVQIGAGTDWAKISAGKNHTMAIKTGGTLWGWGANNRGQIGDRTATGRSSPVQIGSRTDWVAVSCGLDHTLAVRNESGSFTLWAWGSNYDGRLGLGSSDSCEFPVQITGSSVTGTDWSSVECASLSSSAIKNNGTLWTWGYNFYGELGLGDRSNRSSPIQVGSDTDWFSTSGGRNHIIAIKNNRTLWAWGRNSSGQLGIGVASTTGAANRSSPVQVGTGTTGDWWKAECGDFHSVALTNSGLIWTWGRNNYGQLGLNSTVNQSSPVQVGSGSTGSWIAISCGGLHTMAIMSLGSTGSTSGSLWAWGRNYNGQLGISNVQNRSSPVQVGSDTDWWQVRCGSSHTVAIKTNGTLWAWGRNNSGQLGTNNVTYRSSPVQIGTGTTGDWNFIDCNHFDSTMAIKRDGTLWGWGGNFAGELGIGSFGSVSSPVQVVSTSPNEWDMVSCGQSFTLGKKPNGTIWSWGSRQAGRGAIGFIVSVSSPVQIGSLTDWGNRQVESATNHNMIIR